MRLFLNLCGIFFILTSMTVSAQLKQFPRDGYTYRNRSADRGFGKYAARSLYHTKRVALTYDDGPNLTSTPRILDLLKKYGVHATFFAMGHKITNPAYAKVIKRIIQEGHILASHDWNHKNNNRESRTVFKRGLKRSIVAIEKLYAKYAPGRYVPELYFRFPYGAYGSARGFHHFNVMKEISQELYGENCLNFVFWDIDTDDWLSSMTSQNVFQNIVANLVGGRSYVHKRSRRTGKFIKVRRQINHPIGGGVVLMHDIHAKNIRSTELFLKYARSHNVKIVPLSDVREYSYSGKSCELLSPL